MSSVKLVLGDCLDMLREMEPGSVEAVICDPPYGIGWTGHNGSEREWRNLDNDDGTLNLRSILSLPCLVIAFGANNYPEQLPHRGRWICWDKRIIERSDRMLGSPFELAWTNKTTGFGRMYRVMHGGVVNADGHNAARVHPTQKPLILMRRIILDYTQPGDTILDPFMGSGTTGVAAVQTGRNFVGVEIDEGYFKTAQRRIAEAQAQPPLIPHEQYAQPVQNGLLEIAS